MCSLLVALTVTCVVPTQVGAWHGPIRPGDHVFDAKRFADSVKETAEQVKVFMNKVEKTISMQTWRLTTNINKVVVRVFPDLQDKLTLETVQSSTKNPEGTPAGQTSVARTEVHHTTNPFEFMNALTTYLHDTTVEGLALTKEKSGKNTQTRMEAIDKIVKTETAGVVGEKQKGIAIEAMSASQSADNARINIAKTVEQITKTQTEEKAKTMDDIQATKVINLVVDDPYHPTEISKHKTQTSESFGFPSF